MAMRFFGVFLFILVLAFGWSVSGPSLSQERDRAKERAARNEWKDPEYPVVVELFTAPDCSACIPADRLLYDISKKKNVIALGCHIDYWDRTTMDDPTGLEECTYRQWAYKSSGAMSSAEIEVPHFMINGNFSINGIRMREFYGILRSAMDNWVVRPLFINMTWKDEDTLLVTLPKTDREVGNEDSFSVWLVRYQDSLIEKIDKGETAGRVLRFSNVVRDARHIAKWHGDSRTIEVDVPTPPGGKERGGYVTIIHQINGSDILAAGKVLDYVLQDEKTEEKAEAAPPVSSPMLSPTPSSE